jgi:hypothetical protein
VHLFKSDQADLELVADEQSQILEYALGVVNGEVDSNGSGTYSIESMMYDVDKKNIDYVLEGEKVNFDDLKSVRFRAYYFTQPQDEEVYPKNLKTHINRILREKGGVRVYRNGFRVPPYGSKQDDWIGLAESTAKRKVLPPHSNSNWIGIVELSDSNGQVFEEKSSREGLIEGNAFQELKVFLYKALTDTAVQIAVAREKKITAGQKDWKTSTSQNNPATAIKEVASELDDIFRLEKKNRENMNQRKIESLIKRGRRLS